MQKYESVSIIFVLNHSQILIIPNEEEIKQWKEAQFIKDLNIQKIYFIKIEDIKDREIKTKLVYKNVSWK